MKVKSYQMYLLSLAIFGTSVISMITTAQGVYIVTNSRTHRSTHVFWIEATLDVESRYNSYWQLLGHTYDCSKDKETIPWWVIISGNAYWGTYTLQITNDGSLKKLTYFQQLWQKFEDYMWSFDQYVFITFNPSTMSFNSWQA